MAASLAHLDNIVRFGDTLISLTISKATLGNHCKNMYLENPFCKEPTESVYMEKSEFGMRLDQPSLP